MKGSVIYSGSCRRVLTRREEIRSEEGASGYRTIVTGVEQLEYRLIANPVALDNLARRAASNKNGKSKLGPFTVEITAARSEGRNV